MKKNMKIKNGELLIITIILIFIVFLIFELVLSYFSTFVELGNQKSDWGTFGDFIGGTLNPLLSFFGFMALLYTISIQRKQIKDDKKDKEKQQFESTFFALLNLHNQALDNLSKEKQFGVREGNSYPNGSDLQNLLKETLDKKVTNLEIAQKKLNDKNNLCGHYFRILYELLKFIKNNSSWLAENEKMYSNLVKGLLPDNVFRLLAVYCSNKDDYKLLLEHYSFFENIDFSDNSILLEFKNNFTNSKLFGENYSVEVL
jgi:phosphotransferase system  glucose/maltose/N-acetylglucosamine-specific IIC component